METVRGSKPGDCFIRVAVHPSRYRHAAAGEANLLTAGYPGAAGAAQPPLQRPWRQVWSAIRGIG